MPGAYAHITLVNILKETERLEGIAGFPVEAITAVLDYFKFCEPCEFTLKVQEVCKRQMPAGTQ